MLRSDYWLASDSHADDLLMAPEQLPAWQARFLQSSNGALCDLATHPAELTNSELSHLLQAWEADAPQLYSQGSALDPARLRQVMLNRNLEAVKPSNPVSWGVTVSATDMRLYPAAEPWFESPTDTYFDVLQGSVLDPGEPIAVLFTSADGLWYFVQAQHSDGWVRSQEVALATKEQWLAFVQPTSFLVVTGSRLLTEPAPHGEPLTYRMGARLPLAAQPWPVLVEGRTTAGTWVVNTPARDAEGRLLVVPGVIPVSAPVRQGYLPYTRRNVLQQAFLFLGEPYGWGGAGGQDCSYLVAMVYRCFGLVLPRNSWYQEQLAAADTPVSASNWEQFDKALTGLPAGASLHLKGHVMLYLGKVGQRHFVLHALAAHGQGIGCREGGNCLAPGAKELEGKAPPQRIEVMRTVVSDVDLVRTNGSSLALSITKAKVYAAY